MTPASNARIVAQESGMLWQTAVLEKVECPEVYSLKLYQLRC